MTHSSALPPSLYVLKDFESLHGTVKPRNSGQLEQLDFFRYCGVFRYFEGSEALNRAFWGQKLSAIEGFSAILTSAIAGFYCMYFALIT